MYLGNLALYVLMNDEISLRNSSVNIAILDSGYQALKLTMDIVYVCQMIYTGEDKDTLVHSMYICSNQCLVILRYLSRWHCYHSDVTYWPWMSNQDTCL